ncbi:MAG TPA: BTAD domain-containing putative transcriptional regulator [Streptosporangiaceae bacterium]|nr:BTAD domain-containing putative transcriptional regulator [Streptosporangiaceae bacterium]
MTVSTASVAHETQGQDATEFRLLGTLTVAHGDTFVPVTSGKQRAVLAALLVHANQCVTAEDLIEIVWSEPPRTARVTLQNYVKRIRHILGSSGSSVYNRLISQPSGYLICASDDELDIRAFTSGCAAGHRAATAGNWELAVSRWSRALSLWRGTPFADVPSEVLAAGERCRLQEMRLQTLESRLEMYLRLGCHAEVMAEARLLVAAEPFRERLHEALLLALYRSGQRAEALAAYRSIRGQLASEIGIDPGPALQHLHQQILNDDPGLWEQRRRYSKIT